MHWRQMHSWSPDAVGAAMGVLSWFSFLLSDKYLRCSTTYSRLSGMIEPRLRGPVVEVKDDYRKAPLAVDWQFMFVIGILIGVFCPPFSPVHSISRWCLSFGVSSLATHRVLPFLVAFLAAC